eukprot:TRINITY_DN2071_c0_g1_i1.p1 TRINITY_DN2071_c0_g1~~TRINITY_DN2071_c0_g1_i1.p1  ORF type:complete len:744 (+),score=178.34 TRINITY_DN2071_c0_g1_i1:283-2514(+)
MEGYLPTVQFLVTRASAPINCTNATGFTPFHSAAQCKRADVFQWLLEQSKEPNPLALVNDNQWTCLHVAACVGSLEVVRLILSREDGRGTLNATDVVSHTPLFLAVSNHHIDIVQLLLEAGADQSIKSGAKRKLPVWIAARVGHLPLLRMLVEAASDAEQKQVAPKGGSVKALIEATDANYSSVLHAAAANGDVEVIQYLLNLPVSYTLEGQQASGQSVLHIAACHGHVAALRIFLDYARAHRLDIAFLLSLRSMFGSKPLHEAVTGAHVDAVRLLIEAGSDVNAQDNDGQSALHMTAAIGDPYGQPSTASRKSPEEASRVAREIATLLLQAGANPNQPDLSGNTPLHAACCRPSALELARVLVAWPTTDLLCLNHWQHAPLHTAAARTSTADTYNMLREVIAARHSEWLETFDPQKPRVKSGVRPAVGPSALLSAEEKQAVLGGEVSLQRLASLLAQGKFKNIVVLSGAGISTTAGIPDFRSKQGFFGQNPKQSSFDMATFLSDPQHFYQAVVKAHFLPVTQHKVRPTVCHYFVKLLARRGLLRRWYSQNVDMLEQVVGIEPHHLVTVHGTFASGHCTNSRCGQPALPAHFWASVERDEVPVCGSCGSVIKPDVVFFGEPLPSAYLDHNTADSQACDLFIGMGSSLLVYPIAALPNQVDCRVPRLFINREATGPFRSVPPALNLVSPAPEAAEKEAASESENYRDVVCLGNCDDVIWRLVELAGWKEELEAMQNEPLQNVIN